MLVEVLRRKAAIPLPIQRLNARRLRITNTVRRSHTDPTVAQAVLPLLTIPGTPPAKRPFAHPKQLTRLRLARRATRKSP